MSEILQGVLYFGGREAAERLAPPPAIHVCLSSCTHSSGSKIVRFPLKDDPTWAWRSDPAGTGRLVMLVNALAKLALEGKSVLVTCESGVNSSSLVTVLTLCAMGFRPQRAIDLVQDLRGADILSNEAFYDCACELGGDLSRNPVQTYRTKKSPTLQLSEPV